MKKIIIYAFVVFCAVIIIASFFANDTDTADDTIDTTDNVETTAAETTSNIELSFHLTEGKKGEYGRTLVYNEGTEFEESIFAYYVPAGQYNVTNSGEYQTQINVLKEEKNIVDGWEEGIPVEVFIVAAGETKTFTVPEGCHIEIAEPTYILMEKLK